MFDYLATFNPKLNGQGIGWNETYLIEVYSYFLHWGVYVWEHSSDREYGLGYNHCIDISKDPRFNFVDWNNLTRGKKNNSATLRNVVELGTDNLHKLLNHLTRLNNMKVFL